ncbi:hypothetical protein ACQW02_06735 [Humitalea sp. 24SJ18S-53]|uniref:hypothetical protein n=1 Tax=Humitalea sp. 24SJ18S-53 TaxID=3422307 RepID=UPI003D663E8C
MDNSDQARLHGPKEATPGDAALAARAMAFDPGRYRHYLAHLDMSEEAQTELLNVVWRIMEGFVDRAFGHDAAQLARNAGDNLAPVRARNAGAEVSSGHSTHTGTGTLADAFRLSGEGDSKERTGSHAD